MSADSYHNFARWYDLLFGQVITGLNGIGLRMHPPRRGMTVLDVGCGTGLRLRHYQRAGCEVFGVDTSPAMLRSARRKLGNRANLHLGDASHLPYPYAAFDLITASMALHEMSCALRAGVMNEMKRALKEDGRLLLIDYHSGPLKFPYGWLSKGLITIIERAAGGDHYRNYCDFIARQSLPALCTDHGLTVEKTTIVAGGNLGVFLLRVE